MTQFNPMAPAIMAGAVVQSSEAAAKLKESRRARALVEKRDVRDDELQHQVESDEELPAIHDQDSPHREPPRREGQPKSDSQAVDPDEPPHIDVKA